MSAMNRGATVIPSDRPGTPGFGIPAKAWVPTAGRIGITRPGRLGPRLNNSCTRLWSIDSVYGNRDPSDAHGAATIDGPSSESTKYLRHFVGQESCGDLQNLQILSARAAL
jgi:hypothetical protein